MSSVDVAEAFALIYDVLSLRQPVTTQIEAWPDEPGFASAHSFWSSAVSDDADVDDSLLTGLDAMPSADLFGALRALDDVLSAANTPTPSSDPATAELQLRRHDQGAYLNSPNLGAVVAKRVEQRQVQVAHETLRDALHVLRIAPETWRLVDFVVPSKGNDLPHTAGATMKVAALPMGADLADLTMNSTTTKQGRRIYVGEPSANLVDRVADAADALTGADIGLAPELVLDDDILDEWRQALSAGDAPTWVFVGTGPVQLDPAAPVAGMSATPGPGQTAAGKVLLPNRGVLVHGPTGDLLAVQDKRSGFTITAGYRDAYGLGHAPDENHDEGMSPGSRMTIVESRAGRFAFFICEDLARESQWAATLSELGVTHLLVPILATPMEEYRWQQQAAGHNAQQAGATTLVFNSVILGRFEPTTGEPARTLLVVEPIPGEYSARAHWEANDLAASMTAEQDATTPRQHDVVAR